MRIVCVGGGPGGLYFALLMKRSDPRHEVSVIERNRAEDTFGFGVVFSDATMAGIAEADADAYDAIAPHLVRWNDIHVCRNGEIVTSTGHGFSGMSRHMLLRILQEQTLEAGVRLEFQRDVDDIGPFERDADLIVAADGVNSTVRRFLEPALQTTIDLHPNRFVWLGTTKPLPAFTFYFRETPDGVWRVHAYQYAPGRSTFIVECREETWRLAGMDAASEDETARFLEGVFADELKGHRLLTNRSLWRQFPTVRTAPWSAGKVVLIGDAAHTAHFSVGSGTRMAMEDAIALKNALTGDGDLGDALAAYEAERRPKVESLQRAAQASLEWFEHTERYMGLDALQFTCSLLTRSLRITHEDLSARDPALVRRIDEQVARSAAIQTGEAVYDTPPPMFTPLRLRGLIIRNRVAVCLRSRSAGGDGAIADSHLVQCGTHAVGGAGLLIVDVNDARFDGAPSPVSAPPGQAREADSWRRVVDFIHRETAARIGVRLGASGWVAEEPDPGRHERSDGPAPRELGAGQMERILSEYAMAVELALMAGFDFVEINMARGSLLGAFLCPLTNGRADAYGGIPANRMRFPLAVFERCRQRWPADRPMAARISAKDWLDGGITPGDAVETACALKALGCDMVHVSAGYVTRASRASRGRLCLVPFADQIRHEAGIATIAAGDISTYMDVNTTIAAGRADLCAVTRAHLFDPYWTRHAAATQRYPLPGPDPCRVDGHGLAFDLTVTRKAQ